MMRHWLRIMVVLAGILISGPLWGISEKDFFKVYNAEVAPFFEAGDTGVFTGVGGVNITWWKSVPASSPNAVVILTGYTESLVKYRELAYDLGQAGFSIYMMDHRGMGLSQRMIPDDHLPVFVDSFMDYVADVKRFMDTVVAPDRHNHIFLLAHSMGGCVAVNYLIAYDTDITAAVLSAPMLSINFGNTPEWLIYWVTRLLTLLGKGQVYAPSEGPRQAAVFENNALTGSYARWSVWNKMVIPENPAIVSGGATNRWVSENIKATRHARKNAAAIKTPLLLLQAGRDTVVTSGGQDLMCDTAENCTIAVFPEAKHEILMEVDAIRDKAIATLSNFMANLQNAP